MRFFLLASLLPGLAYAGETSSPSRHATVVIAGDSFSVGVLGTYFEKKLSGARARVARYGVSGSRISHWLEKNSSDTTMEAGAGVSWTSPENSGGDGPPAGFPKLKKILETAAPKKLVLILGTNDRCDETAAAGAAELVRQAKSASPMVRCYWVGPKLFEKLCGGNLAAQKKFSRALGTALEGKCRFIDGTRLGLPPGELPHVNDGAEAWAEKVAPLLAK